MPQTPTTYMLLVQPSENGDDDVWDTLLTAVFLLIDAHDHTTGKGTKVPTGGINIDGELEFNGKQATELGGAAFNNLGAPLSGGTYIAHVAGGNLYFRNATTNVQITSGATLNMTTVGGIAGDYTSVSAEVAYVDAQDGYTFKQQVGAAVRQYAKMDSADVRLYEFKAHPAAGVPTNFVGLASPAALAASYTLTMPAALPGLTTLVQMSATGAISTSNTVANSITLSSLLTALGGVTCGVNTDVTISGTGQFKHGNMLRTVSPLAGQGSAWTLAAGYVQSGGAQTYYLPIPLDVGERVTTVDVTAYGDGVVDVTIDVCLYSAPSGGLLTRTVIGTVSNVNQAASWGTNTINVTDTTLATGEQIIIEYQPNAAGLRVGPATATYNRP